MEFNPAKRRKLASFNDLENINHTKNGEQEACVAKFFFNYEEKADNKSKRSYSVEDGTTEILNFLQKKGKTTLKELNEELDVPYRRSSDILNVLKTTPLLSKQGSKRSDPFVFCTETSVPEVVNIKSIEEEIEKEKQRIEELKQKLQAKNTINK